MLDPGATAACSLAPDDLEARDRRCNSARTTPACRHRELDARRDPCLREPAHQERYGVSLTAERSHLCLPWVVRFNAAEVGNRYRRLLAIRETFESTDELGRRARRPVLESLRERRRTCRSGLRRLRACSPESSYGATRATTRREQWTGDVQPARLRPRGRATNLQERLPVDSCDRLRLEPGYFSWGCPPSTHGHSKISRQADTWSQFRGSLQRTGRSAARLPDQLRLLWSFEAGFSIDSSAAIVGDVVYMTALPGLVAALKLADGEVIWSRELW